MMKSQPKTETIRFKLIRVSDGKDIGLPAYTENEARSAMMHLSQCHGEITRMKRVS